MGIRSALAQAVAEVRRVYISQPLSRPPVPLAKTLAGILIGTLILGVLFHVLERLFPETPAGPAFRRPGSRIDFIYWFFDFFVAKRLATAAALGVVIVLVAFKAPRLTFVAAQPLWLQALEALLVADFCGYWSHRMMHEIPFLWRIHRIHHSSERIDWLAAARVHPFEGVWNRMISIAPLFLMGFSPKITAVFGPILAFYPIFIHCNVPWGYGWLGYVVASPAFHRRHHAADADALNRNYSGLLPLFDFIFGTAHFPRGAKPARYGLATESAPSTFWRQLLWPFTSRTRS